MEHMYLEIKNIYACLPMSIYFYIYLFLFLSGKCAENFTIVPVSEQRHFLQCVKLWSTYTDVYMHVRYIYIHTYMYILTHLHELVRIRFSLSDSLLLSQSVELLHFSVVRTERANEREKDCLYQRLLLLRWQDDFVVCNSRYPNPSN